MPPKLKADPKKIEAERLTGLLQQLLREEENKYCAECEAKQPRWASWNLGVFLCIRCAGLHRNLGVHISKVKSVNLDSWTAEQVQSMRVMGNAKAKAVYESELPSMFRRPQSDHSLESFIRAKYEAKRYILKDWSPPPVNADVHLPFVGMTQHLSAWGPVFHATPKKFKFARVQKTCHVNDGCSSPGSKSVALDSNLTYPKISEKRVEKEQAGPLTGIPMSSHSNQSLDKSAQVPGFFDSQVGDSPVVLVNLFDSPVHSVTPMTHYNENFATQISDNLDDLFGPIVSAGSNLTYPTPNNGEVHSTAFSTILPSTIADHQQSVGLVGSTSADSKLFALGGVSSVGPVEPQLKSINFNSTSSQSDNKKSTMDIMALFGNNARPPPSQSMPAFNSSDISQNSAPPFTSSMMVNTQPLQPHQPPTTTDAMRPTKTATPQLSGLDNLFGQFKL